MQAQEGSAPDKPTGLSATAPHDHVVLTWDDPGDASITGYVILRRVRVNNTGGEFSELVADTGTAATTYTDATVKANTIYTYRIQGDQRARGERAFPLVPHRHTGGPPSDPTSPRAWTPRRPTTRWVLTWDDPDDDSITGYVILRRVRVNDTGGEFSVLVADTGATATTYTDDSVQANTTYTYRIKAINEHGVSERSHWFHIDTPAAPEAVKGDDQDGEDGGGAPGHATPPGPGKRANVSEPDDEDLPADTTTTGVVEVGGVGARGAIHEPKAEIVTWTATDDEGREVVHESTVYDFDTDWFAVVLEAGKTYRIDMKGQILSSPGLDMPGVPVDPELTLSLPQINAIYDADGNYLLNHVGGGRIKRPPPVPCDVSRPCRWRLLHRGERRVVRVGRLRADGHRHHGGYRLTHGRPQQGIEDCDAEGAIGTRDGRMLSDELALTVSGPG